MVPPRAPSLKVLLNGDGAGKPTPPRERPRAGVSNDASTLSCSWSARPAASAESPDRRWRPRWACRARESRSVLSAQRPSHPLVGLDHVARPRTGRVEGEAEGQPGEERERPGEVEQVLHHAAEPEVVGPV